MNAKDTAIYEKYRYLINNTTSEIIISESDFINKNEKIKKLFSSSNKIYMYENVNNGKSRSSSEYLVPYNKEKHWYDSEKGVSSMTEKEIGIHKHDTESDKKISMSIIDRKLTRLFKCISIEPLDIKYIIRLIEHDRVNFVNNNDNYPVNEFNILIEKGYIEILLTVRHPEKTSKYIIKHLKIDKIIYLLKFAADNDIELTCSLKTSIKESFLENKLVSIQLARNNIFNPKQFMDYDVIKIYADKIHKIFDRYGYMKKFTNIVEQYVHYDESIKNLYQMCIISMDGNRIKKFPIAEYVQPSDKKQFSAMLEYYIEWQKFDVVEKILDHGKNIFKKFEFSREYMIENYENILQKYPYLIWICTFDDLPDDFFHTIYNDDKTYKYDIFEYVSEYEIKRKRKKGMHVSTIIKKVFSKFEEFDIIENFLRTLIKQDIKNYKKVISLIFSYKPIEVIAYRYHDIITRITNFNWKGNHDVDISFLF